MYYNRKKLKPGLVAFYDVRPGNGAGLLSKEKVSKERDMQAKSEEKRTSEEARDINKQTIYIYIYIVPKSKMQSSAHYAA